MLTLDLDEREFVSWRESIQFNIEGLSSLKMFHFGSNTDEVDFSMRNLPSLTKFSLSIACSIDECIVTRLLEQMPYIEELCLDAYLHTSIWIIFLIYEFFHSVAL